MKVIVRKRRQAMLPEGLEETTIDSLTVGESGWTVPWAMWVDKQRHCWLNPSYTIQAQPGGTVAMKVERTEDGFRVWGSALGHKWHPVEQPSYVGQEGSDWLSVVELL